MSKRNAIIIIVLTIVLGTSALYFLLGGKATNIVAPIFDGSPFGTPPGDTAGTPSTDGETQNEGGVDELGRPLPSFLKLSDTPVSGFVSILKNGLTHVRFVDRATGHVFDVNPSTLQKTKIINTTLPRVYEAVFKLDGSGFLAKTLDEDEERILSTAISLTPPQSTSTDAIFTAQATAIRGVLGEVSTLPNGNLLYVDDESGAVVTSTFAGGSLRTLFSLPYSSWRFYPYSNMNALIVSKASRASFGYAYTLNISNGRLTKVLGPLRGLSAVPNNTGNLLAYSHTGGPGLLAVKNVTTGTETNIIPNTLAEKCVWSKRNESILYCAVPSEGLGANFPDGWYEGSVSYADRIWRFNTNTDTAEILLDPEKNFEQKVDVLSPALSPDEDFLVFINKSDLSLWALKLELE